MKQPELVLDCRNQLGECPLWDDRVGELVWVDIYGRRLLRWSARQTASPSVDEFSEFVCAVALRNAGGFVLALQSSFAFFDPNDSALERIAELPLTCAEVRLNDGCCDRQGHFVCGGINEAADAAALVSVYRLNPDRSVQSLFGEVVCSNSICFSPDGTLMYFADTPERRILAYKYDGDRGVASKPTVFVDLSTEAGMPDGSTVDEEGCLWNAEWGGGRVVRYTPDGEVERIVRLPVPHVTCVAFGGKDLQTLYITTARSQLDEQSLLRKPYAGGLFALRPGIRGLAEPGFIG